MATVSPQPRTNRITLSFSTAGPFEVGFRLFDTEALDVYVDGLPRTDWTLTATFLNGFSDTATITFDAPLDNGAVIQIDGAMIPAREDDYINGPALVALMNVELARVWASLSEINRIARTAVRGFDDQDPVEGISASAFAGLEDALEDAETAALSATASAAAALASQNAAAASAALLGVWRGAWAPATVYALGDRVSNAGSSYYALVAHTSSALFSTDLSGGKWGVLAEKGAAGAGTGDVLAANNGSDFVNKPTVLSNIGAQPVHANLTAEAGLTGAADRLSYYTGVGAKALTILTTFARQILDDTDAAAMRTTLGLGALAAINEVTISQLAAALVVTEAEGIASNDNDTTIPTSAAVKDFVDGQAPYEEIVWNWSTNVVQVQLTGLGNFKLLDLDVRLTTAQELRVQVSDDGGSTWRNTNYAYLVGDIGGHDDTPATSFRLSRVAPSGGLVAMSLKLGDFNQAAPTFFAGHGRMGARTVTVCGTHNAGVAMNALRIITSDASTNITAGRIVLRGYR